MNCSKRKGPDRGDGLTSVSMEVVLASGVEVHAVNYSITGNGITPRNGAINVSGRNSSVSVLVTGLPPGTGYRVDLAATATDGTTMCSGSSLFDVLVGQTTAVSVRLDCRKAGTTGDVLVNGSFNTCPLIDSHAVSPLATDVGRTIDLRAVGHDDDCTMQNGPTCTAFQAVTIGWTATAGTIAPANAANAAYTCTQPGTHTLTLTVTDGLCPVTRQVQVNCVSDSCGNGTREPAFGEECDGTDTPSPGQVCDANCRIVPRCGNGVTEAPEMCDPPNVGPGQPNTCDSMCRGIPIECGNNLVQPGEQCDPPSPGVCTATCQTFVARCGDGVVNQTSEQCDDGNTNNSDGCNTMCQIVLSPCEQCERDGWVLQMRAACNPASSGCTQLTGMDRTLCENLVSCMRMTGCPVNATGDAQPCYCGTASDLACLGGAANGMCRTQVEAAAKIPAGTPADQIPEMVANGFADASLPLGRAANLMRCDAAACGGICTF
jgi:cysteine-rich repeat protein